MNALFERYVENLLRPIARARGLMMRSQGWERPCLHPQDGSKAVFQTLPDIQIHDGGGVRLVIDTKWKRLTDRARDARMDVDQADIYQLMAYAQLYEAPVLLLYPKHSALVSPMPVTYRIAIADGPTRLTVAALDILSHCSARDGLEKLLNGQMDAALD